MARDMLALSIDERRIDDLIYKYVSRVVNDIVKRECGQRLPLPYLFYIEEPLDPPPRKLLLANKKRD